MKLIPEKYKIKKGSRAQFSLAGFSKLGNYLSLKDSLLMFLSLILLFGSVLAYFGLLGYKNSLIDKKEMAANKVEELQNQRDLKTEATFIELKKKINALKGLLKIHTYPSRIFQILEESALPQVRFIDLRADLPKRQLVLNAEAADYGVLAKQITIFKEDSRISKVDVSEISLDKSGYVSSKFLLEIDTALLR
ncbi:MAG: hypothetical protein U9P63_02130 [Patescibacteria group bacterium]|nr:hypothetical protein [Patescibacteria group bacterium]